MTTKREDFFHLEVWALSRPATGTLWDASVSMSCRRLKVYHLTKRLPKPPKALRTCPRRFAELSLTLSSATSSLFSPSSDQGGATFGL